MKEGNDSQLTILGPKISIVIVVWNAKRYITECLESLYNVCRNSNLEVIVVDNLSTDGAPDFIESAFPAVKLIRNSDNLGFAKANNIGIRAATGDYVCLVNSDVKFTSDCFKPMIEYLNANPDVGLLGPMMRTGTGDVARSTMRFPTVWNSLSRALALDSILRRSMVFNGQLMGDFDHKSTRDVEVLNGWFWMVPRAALNDVGLLDEQFFIYGEDFDWSYRFHLAHKRVVFFAEAEAIHYGGASSAAAPLRFFLELQHANSQFYRKHYGYLTRLGLVVTSIMHHSTRAVGHGVRAIFSASNRAESKEKFNRSATCLFKILRHPL